MADNQENVKIRYELEDKATPGIKNMSSAFTGAVVKGQALYDGLKLVASGIGYMISSAEESRQVMAQTEAVLASTGGAAGVTSQEIVTLAESLSMMTNYDDEAIQSGENLLLTFTKIGKEVFPQATETMLDMSAALGQDLKSSALQLGKALNDPIQGITALRRVGVSFTEQQIEQIKVLQDSGNVLGAQKIILAELNTEFGGTARATASGMTILKNQLGNVAEAVGGILLPALNSAAGGVAKLITTFQKYSFSDVAVWFFKGADGVRAYREELKKLDEEAKNAGVGDTVKFKKSDSYKKELQEQIKDSETLVRGYYSTLEDLKKHESSIENIYNRQSYEKKIETLKKSISDERATLDERRAIMAAYNAQVEASDSKGKDKKIKTYDEMMKAHELYVSDLQAKDKYTADKEISNLYRIRDTTQMTGDERVKINVEINKLIRKRSDETYDDIMEHHKESVTQMQLNNQYTHDSEIQMLQNLLSTHTFTQNQQLLITHQINALKLQSHKDTSSQFLAETQLMFDGYRDMGDLWLLYGIESNKKLLESDKLTAEDRKKLEEGLAKDKKAIRKNLSESYISSIVDMADKEMSIQDQLLRGTFNFVKKQLLAALDAKAAVKIAEVWAEAGALSLPTFGTSFFKAAGLTAGITAAVATAHTVVESIKLAEGGVVMPRPGGTNAIIGEAGRPEAVIPLGSSKANKILGSGNNQGQSEAMKVIILDSDGRTMLAKGLYKETSRLIRTGQIAEARI